jgi:hypothetical protein
MRWSFLLVFAACGPNAVDDIFIGDGGVLPVDATTKFGDGGDASSFDAGIDGPQFNGGGPFFCYNCTCDGTLDMCFNGGGGGGAPIADASADVQDASDDASDAAPVCNADAAPTECVVMPTVCLPKPTCACIEKVVGAGCICSVDPSGNGFNITCPPKP